MAELVDALGSGPSGGNTVEVRVLFWAPNLKGPLMRTFLFYDRRNDTSHSRPERLSATYLYQVRLQQLVSQS
jgi:hypothetical protein